MESQYGTRLMKLESDINFDIEAEFFGGIGDCGGNGACGGGGGCNGGGTTSKTMNR